MHDSVMYKLYITESLFYTCAVQRTSTECDNQHRDAVP